MKKILILFLLSSCQGIKTQPKEDPVVTKIIEEISKNIYDYEMGPQLVLPPLK